MKNILVTGGSGFIGRNLIIKLKALGHNVINCDINAQYPDYNYDISNYTELIKITDDIDLIYHLAAQSYGYKSLTNPELDLEWNAKGTLNICRFAKRREIKKIVYTSTMAVYGDGDWLTESDELNPLSNYAISKLYGETCVKQFSQFGIDYTIFRLFNTYGPGQNLTNGRQGVAAVFVQQVIRGNRIDVTGSLQRYRDLTYIDDTINALILGLSGKTSQETYNVCSKIKVTIEYLISKFIHYSGRSIGDFNVSNIGDVDGDQFGNTGDNTKLKTLGWSPKIDIDTGLSRLYKYANETINKVSI
jgi:UDP-glucose 4-epimerase|tara:strand:- start:3181 stop:4089 length:909 start_codon:yes stop_codon:yes gene_type:complete